MFSQPLQRNHEGEEPMYTGLVPAAAASAQGSSLHIHQNIPKGGQRSQILPGAVPFLSGAGGIPFAFGATKQACIGAPSWLMRSRCGALSRLLLARLLLIFEEDLQLGDPSAMLLGAPSPVLKERGSQSSSVWQLQSLGSSQL